MEHHVDVIIIGAGIAGLAAARKIQKANERYTDTPPITYAVLEASDRSGGRVRSKTIELPDASKITVDTGMHWIHSDPSGQPINPLLGIAHTLPIMHDFRSCDFYKGGDRMSMLPQEKRINRAQKLLKEHQGRDVSIRRLAEEHELGGDRGFLETTFGSAESGASIDDTGIRELGCVPRLMGDIIKGGMEKLIDKLEAPVKDHVKRSTPVKEIHWKNDDGMIKIVTDTGNYCAKHLVVTASIGVLKSGEIRFVPPLPASHQEALNHIDMVHFNKVFLCFDKSYKFNEGVNKHMDVITRDGDAIFYQVRDNGQPVVTAYLGGDLGTLPAKESTEITIKGLAEIWGDAIRGNIHHTETTNWHNEPYIRGSYSLAKVGKYSAREMLAQPIDDKIFFAGEAMRTIDPQTKANWTTHGAGAYISGNEAAEQILQNLGRNTPQKSGTGRSAACNISR